MKKFNMRFLGVWVLATIITLAAVIYQRRTGPTYPLRENIEIADQNIRVELERSHAGPGDQLVSISVRNNEIAGELIWRRYPTSEAFTTTHMQREDDKLIAYLPHQPPAGKLEYKVRLYRGSEEMSVPVAGTAITRFRRNVPAYILIPHILFMFLAMAYSNRAGIEALSKRDNILYYARITTILLFVGGMILGPLVQKFAFEAFWTGFPFGHDLTDNKTLVAFIGWLIVLLKVRKHPDARAWVLGAALLTLTVYLIPHSLLGSELKYE